MTQKEKKLVLIDLCSRLPNGVKCKILENNEIKILGSIQYDGENTLFDFWEDDQKIQYGYQLYLSEFKPYLFPISSMTEKQLEVFYCNFVENEIDFNDFKKYHFEINSYYKLLTSVSECPYVIDWFIKNHFDYRGLIDKGLAIDATDKNIY